MESYDFLLFVAIILLSTKIFSLLSQKVDVYKRQESKTVPTKQKLND